jgi:hypothetical protein
VKTIALPASGHCRCGKVRFRISAPPILTMACHCRGCQRMSASAFSLSAAIPVDGFEVTQGEPVIGGMHDPELRHFFCPHCMSWMFTRFVPQFVNVRVTLLEDASWFAPFIETWTKTRLPWATTPAVHSFAEFPTFEEFPALSAEFLRRSATARPP